VDAGGTPRKLEFETPASYKRCVPATDASVTRLDTLRCASAVGRWVFLRGLRQPAIGVLVLVLIGWVPLQARLSPLGDIARDPAWILAGAWVLPLGLVGMALALTALGQARAFLELLPWGSRWLGEALGLLVGALGLQIPLVLGAAWIGHGGPGFAPFSWLLADLHAAAIGLLLLRWDSHSVVRVGFFGGLLWFLPAMLPPTGFAAGLRVLADAGGPGLSSPTTEVWLSRAAVVASLVLASILLASLRFGVAPPASHAAR
jgi:hypothetical protein